VLPPPETEKNGKGKEKNRSVEKQIQNEEEEKKKIQEQSGQKWTKINCLRFFFLFAGHRRRGKEEGRKPLWISAAALISRWRVNPSLNYNH
jgi:hypothetical protein